MKLNEDGNLILNNPIKIGKVTNHYIEDYESVIIKSETPDVKVMFINQMVVQNLVEEFNKKEMEYKKEIEELKKTKEGNKKK